MRGAECGVLLPGAPTRAPTREARPRLLQPLCACAGQRRGGLMFDPAPAFRGGLTRSLTRTCCWC
eukprot:751410-Rhodomonas_salina.1